VLDWVAGPGWAALAEEAEWDNWPSAAAYRARHLVAGVARLLTGR